MLIELFLYHCKVFDNLFDIVVEVEFVVSLYGEVVHIHIPFVRIVDVGVTHSQVSIAAGADYLAEQARLLCGVDEKVEMAVGEIFCKTGFRQSEEVEVFLLVTDCRFGVGENIVYLVVFGMETYDVYSLQR